MHADATQGFGYFRYRSALDHAVVFARYGELFDRLFIVRSLSLASAARWRAETIVIAKHVVLLMGRSENPEWAGDGERY